MNYTDTDIIALCSNPSRKREGFTLLMEAYRERLYNIIRRMVIHHEDASDVLQNTFLKVWQGLDQFRGDAKLFTWLYRIATNEAISHLQRGKRQYWDDLPENVAATAQEAATDIPATELLEKLTRAVDILPEKQRAVFVLRYYEEMPYEEMSAMFGTSVGALKASYHHAVKKVERFLLTN
jgi:RNA polymerase sigma factor (sigma-70 family)